MGIFRVLAGGLNSSTEPHPTDVVDTALGQYPSAQFPPPPLTGGVHVTLEPHLKYV